MKRWPHERVERVIRTIASVSAILLFATYVAGRCEIIALSKDALTNVHLSFVALWFLIVLLNIRAERRRPDEIIDTEPPPAIILGVLILLTGGTAVLAAVRGGADASSYVPFLIGVGTILLALFAYSLASKHKDEIGEARFKTPPDPT